MRRAAVGVLAGTLAFSGAALGVGVSPANAVEGFEFERLDGKNRYGTAAEIARDGWGTNAPTVILASGAERNFPDALTGNYLAGEFQAPILLTPPGVLARETREALAALNTNRVIIVGETSAVSAEVEAQVDAIVDDVDRLGGADRYDTAEEVALFVGDDAANVGEDPDQRKTAVLGNGQNFPDILAAGPLGYAEQFPITITPNTRATLEPETKNVLESLDIEHVIIVGGPAAVQPSVQNEVQAMGIEVTRLGADRGGRYETAEEIANYAWDELGFDESHVNLARSDDFADALAGGPHAGEDRAPILITLPNDLVIATQRVLQERCPTLTEGHIFGGLVAISAATEAEAEEAASSCGSDVTITADDTTLTAGEPFTGTIESDKAIESVTISGECVTTATDQTDQDATAGDFQFSVDTIEDPNGGTCVVTFDITFVDGTTASETVTITVTPAPQPEPNTIAVTPDTEDTRTVTQNPDNTTTDDRTFQVGGLVAGETYRITLVDCANVQGSGENATFLSEADENSSTGFSAVTGDPTADIISVNGVAQEDSDANSDTPTAGFQRGTTTFEATGTTANFVVDGDGAGECVVAVVYFDSSTANEGEGGDTTRLEVAGPAGEFSAPVEDFDTSGKTNFVQAAPPAEQPAAPQLTNAGVPTSTATVLTFTGVEAGNVVTVYCEVIGDSAGNDNAGTEDTEFASSATDESTASGFQITVDGLTPNTEYECVGTQTSDEGAESLVSNDAQVITEPLAPTLTEVAVSDTSTTLTVNGLVANATSVTVTCVETSPDSGATADEEPTTTAVDQDPATDGFQVVVEGLDQGSTFACTATQTAVTDGQSRTSDAGAAEAVTTNDGPIITAAVLGGDTSTNTMSSADGRATFGDTFTLTFDQPVNLNVGDTIEVTDADGDLALFECQSNDGTGFFQPGPTETSTAPTGDDITDVACDISADGLTVTVQLLEDADDRNGAGNGFLNYPLTVTDTTGIDSVQSNSEVDVTAPNDDPVID